MNRSLSFGFWVLSNSLYAFPLFLFNIEYTNAFVLKITSMIIVELKSWITFLQNRAKNAFTVTKLNITYTLLTYLLTLLIQLSFKISVEQVLLPFWALMSPTARRSRVTAITLITFFQLCSRKMELIVPFRFNLRLMNWNRNFSCRWKKEDTDEELSSANLEKFIPRDRNFIARVLKYI